MQRNPQKIIATNLLIQVSKNVVIHGGNLQMELIT